MRMHRHRGHVLEMPCQARHDSQFSHRGRRPAISFYHHPVIADILDPRSPFYHPVIADILDPRSPFYHPVIADILDPRSPFYHPVIADIPDPRFPVQRPVHVQGDLGSSPEETDFVLAMFFNPSSRTYLIRDLLIEARGLFMETSGLRPR